MKQKISVIITSYNQKVYLAGAIESVLSQTFQPYEIIICDDASCDGSQDVIKSYKSKYPELIKYIFHEKNLGRSGNRNSGLRVAKGDFLSWLDGDDRYCSAKLENELNTILQNDKLKWVYSKVIFTDENGKLKGYPKTISSTGNIFDTLIGNVGRNPIYPLIEKSVIDKVGYFDERLDLYEDFDFYLRLSKNFECSFCSEPLIEYRQHSGGITHYLPKSEHEVYFKILHENLRTLLTDVPRNMQRKLERAFMRRKNQLFMGWDIYERNRISATKRLLKEIAFNPIMIFHPKTLLTPVRIILGSGIINFIKRVMN